MTWVSPMLVVLLVAADPATLFATEATPGLIVLTFIVVVVVVVLIIIVVLPLLLLKVVCLSIKGPVGLFVLFLPLRFSLSQLSSPSLLEQACSME